MDIKLSQCVQPSGGEYCERIETPKVGAENILKVTGSRLSATIHTVFEREMRRCLKTQEIKL